MATSKMPKEVFLSYGREPEVTAFVKKLKCDLEARGISVWLDTEDIPAGSDWHGAIGTGLEQSKALIAVVTTKYLNSKFCTNELYTASSDQKEIFPVIMEDVDFSATERARGVKYVIGAINWTFFGSAYDYGSSLEHLTVGMRRMGLGGGEGGGGGGSSDAATSVTTDNPVSQLMDGLHISSGNGSQSPSAPPPPPPSSGVSTSPYHSPQPPPPLPPSYYSSPPGPLYHHHHHHPYSTPPQQGQMPYPYGPSPQHIVVDPYSYHSPHHTSPHPSSSSHPPHSPYTTSPYHPHPHHHLSPLISPHPPPPPPPYTPEGTDGAAGPDITKTPLSGGREPPYPSPSPSTSSTSSSSHHQTTSMPASQTTPTATEEANNPLPPPPPPPSDGGNRSFTVGMKLEATDRRFPYYVCVATIMDWRGSDVKIHFDGWGPEYDYWCSARSFELHPPGWCHTHEWELQAPLHQSWTSWEHYLKETDSQGAAHSLFNQEQLAGVGSLLFKEGMKLEARDRQNPSMICVATVAKVKDGKLLIHFDGRTSRYDYWCRPDSPDIHPPHWCNNNGKGLTPPKDFEGRFKWSEFFRQPGPLPAPAFIFTNRQRAAGGGGEEVQNRNSFQPGMRLEAKDRQYPTLVCVATVAAVNNQQLLIHFDGWAINYDYHCDPQSLDIHPVGWCKKTGHDLQKPKGYSGVFTWNKYLSQNGYEAAPAHLFSAAQKN